MKKTALITGFTGQVGSQTADFTRKYRLFVIDIIR